MQRNIGYILYASWNWTIILKQNAYSTLVTNIQNTIYINNSKLRLDKVKCKIYYWHLINNIIHIPKTIIKWENIYTHFKLKDHNFWKAIFKMTFLCSRHTTIQTFQYKIIHRTLPCNEWLNNTKNKVQKCMPILEKYGFNISLPHILQSQQLILENLGKMGALLNWFQYERLPAYT